MPLHALVNYDGQLTGQNGVHSRWEAELFERDRAKLKIAPVAIKPVTDPRDFMFDVLLASNREAADVLEADREAASGRESYDDGYFAAFGRRTLPVMERRLNEADRRCRRDDHRRVGAGWQAGRCPTELARTPRKHSSSKPVMDVYLVPLGAG